MKLVRNPHISDELSLNTEDLNRLLAGEILKGGAGLNVRYEPNDIEVTTKLSINWSTREVFVGMGKPNVKLIFSGDAGRELKAIEVVK